MFHDPTTGAANDIEKATAMARKMVTEFGMSERVRAIKLGQSNGEVFLGRDRATSATTARRSPASSTRRCKLIENAHDEAWHVINDNRERPRPACPRPAREGDPRLGRAGGDLPATSASVRCARSGCPASRAAQRHPAGAHPAEQDAANNGHGQNGYNRNGYGQNGHGPNGHTPQDASGDADMEHKIDQAAEAGAQPLAEEEPRTQVIEVPDGGRVDPTEDHLDGDDGRPRPPPRRCAELLLAVGENPDREGLRDTPERVARAYAETFAGLDRSPRTS